MLFSSSLTTDVPCVHEGCTQDGWSVPQAPVVGKRLKEKWYGTQHQQLDLTKGDLLRRLTDAVNRTTATSVFRPPPASNPYLPSDFDVLDTSALEPAELTVRTLTLTRTRTRTLTLTLALTLTLTLTHTA